MSISSASRKLISTRAPIEMLENRTLLAVVNVSTTADLVNAVNNGAAGDVINVAAGTYTLTASLQPKASMTVQGAGAGSTVLVGNWIPSYSNLPESQDSGSDDNGAAYLFNLAGNDGVKILNMTIDGADKLQGAIFGNDADNLELGHLRIEDTLWSGIRTYLMGGSSIHNSDFVNAGGRWNNGALATSGGVTGGAIYATYATGAEINDNTFTRTNTGAERNFYGIKGYQFRNSRLHHNTINVNFSIELPHMNDHYVEIDHNYILGTVSIPKFAGGSLPTGTNPYTFHIHHNYFRASYALEWARNGAIINSNLFDFSTSSDGGNLITNHDGSTTSNGWTRFHDNLIKNPGRGIYTSSGGVYNNLSFYNNHVIGNTTATPRTEGMFGLPTATDFSTITIRDNIFEFNGQSRPLFRNTASYASNIENNTLTNVSDSGNYSNPNTGALRGPTAPLNFVVGQDGEYTVNGWNIAPTSSGIGVFAATADIGAVAAAGSATHSSGTYTLQGSGADIWNASDEFRYLYMPITGDTTIVARVATLQNTNAWAKSGVMIRESLAANSRNAYVAVSGSNGVTFQRRTSTGGSTVSTKVSGLSAPYWVKLVRSGNNFSAYRSANGTSWSQIGTTISISMSSSAYVGLAVTSHVDGVLCTSTVDNVSVSQPMLAAGPAVDESDQILRQKQARPLLAEAKRRWIAAGIDSSVFAKARLVIADLPDNLLARTDGNRITLDINAAGYGWFIDRTPRSDSEFLSGAPAGMDLLSVLAHELGHVAGLDHADTGVMTPTLAPGVRILPA
jgi:hypothetical protein